jgi:hypothetical protein
VKLESRLGLIEGLMTKNEDLEVKVMLVCIMNESGNRNQLGRMKNRSKYLVLTYSKKSDSV